MPEPVDRVEERLRDLAGALRTDPPPAAVEELVGCVLRRVAAEPAPRPRPVRRRLAALLVALAGTGVAVSPVGAEVVGWLDLGGVVVRTGPGASPSGSPSVPPADGGLTVAEAGERAGFEPRWPRALGAPDAAEVSAGVRVVSLTWEGERGTVRLDQFDGGLAPLFWKSAREVTPVRVGGVEGLWFAEPHEVVVADADGELTLPPRLAARTLVWVRDGRTYRLEADLGRSEAVAVARTLR